MIADSFNPRCRLVLIAVFGNLHDAEAAARLLTDRGIPTKAIGLTTATPNPQSGRGATQRITRPLAFAAVGGVLTGVVGNVLWSTFGPDFLTDGWRAIAPALVGATAAGSIGVAVESGREFPFQHCRPGRNRSSSSVESAVVAVPESQVDDAVRLLRRIGVNRTLVGDEQPESAAVSFRHRRND